MVGGPVLAHQARAVDREDHRQVLQADVVDQLVVPPLQEGRVERHHGPHARRRQPGGEADRVPLGDAHVVEAVRERRLEQIEPRARRHGGGDAHDARVVGRQAGPMPGRTPRCSSPVPPVFRVLPVSIEKGEMPWKRSGCSSAGEYPRPLMVRTCRRTGPLMASARRRFSAQRLDIVPVDDPDVGEPQLLEQHARDEGRLDAVLELLARTRTSARPSRGGAARGARGRAAGGTGWARCAGARGRS